LNFFVQTILCRECRGLYDAVIRLKVPDELDGWGNFGRLRNVRLSRASSGIKTPPTFQAVLNRLPPRGVKRFRWLAFKPQCPVSAAHRVRDWNDPDRCPKCGLFLEKNALPYRLWD
jgi:hypothetical protein